MPPHHRGSAIQTPQQPQHRGSAIQTPQHPPHRGSALRTAFYNSHSPPPPPPATPSSSSILSSITTNVEDQVSVSVAHEAVYSMAAQVQESVIVSFEAKPSGSTANLIGAPRTKTGTVLKYTKGLTNTWKERTMSVDSASVGICVFSENAGSINLAHAHVDVMWAFEEKTGQRYQFSIVEATKEEIKESTKESSSASLSSAASSPTATHKNDKNKSVIRVGNLLELDSWLTALQSHGCHVNRPIRVGAMMLSKKKEESWFLLYPNGLHYFKQRTDTKPTKVVSIGEGTVFERLENDSFVISETGDDQALSLECTPPFAECSQWFECVEAAVRHRLRKKFVQSIREGYLYKSAKNMKFWKKRYFVLMFDHMKYYKKRFDEQHAGIIYLPPGAEAEEEEHVGGGDSASSSGNGVKNTMFWVAENGDESGTRRFHMTARNEAEKDLWLQTLHTMFAKKNPQVVPLSLKEGYLYKATGAKSGLGVHSWSKRYFVLLKDKLIYFKKRNDANPKVSIDLCQGAEIVSFTDTNVSKHPILSIAENGDEERTETYYLYAKDPGTQNEWLEVLSNLLKTKNPRVSEHSVKEGYLRKQGFSNKWNKRYFVLLEKNLLYYKKRGDKQEAGEIPLPGSAEVMRVESDDAENKWQFSVAENGDESGTRIFHMSAPSAELRAQWMQHLQKIIKAKDSRIMIGSFLEGYLWKCPKKGGVWRKRYFVLQQNQLLYFRKRADETEAGSIEVKGEAEISVIDDDLEHPYSFSVAKNGDEGERQVKIYAADHITRNEWVNALRQQTSLLAMKENPNSIREGYIYHWVANTWKKRFFTLEKEPGCLSLFVKRKDQKPSLKFLLDKETVVVWLSNEKIPFHGSVWGKHEPFINSNSSSSSGSSNNNKQELSDPPEEKMSEEGNNGNTEAGEEEKGVSIVLCKSGDADAKNIRLKGVYDMGESLVTEIMTICVSKEFPPSKKVDDASTIVKSGFLSLRQKASGPFKQDRWVNNFVVLTKEKFQHYKHSEDEVPLGICTVDGEAKFYSGAVSGSPVWNSLCMTFLDKTDREICVLAQSKEEKQSWSNVITRSINLCKETSSSNNNSKLSVFRLDIFGAELKNSFQMSVLYQMPCVIALCVEYLQTVHYSVVLLKFPGFHPLIRSFIQDFEAGQEVAFSDPDSVAACLRLYLVLLKKPLISDALVRSLLDVLTKVKKMASSTVSNNEKYVIHQFQKCIGSLDTETSIALSTLLHYLSNELKRPNEPSLILDSILPIWAPLLMRYHKSEDEPNSSSGGSSSEFDSKTILGILIRNIDVFFPGGSPIGVRKLPPKKLKLLREQCNNLTFDVLYKDKYGLELFRRFAKENYIEEEIKFLSAAQQYREMCESSAFSQTQCLAAALLICATYIKQGAETQVNVAATLSTAVLAGFEDPKSPVRSRQLLGHEFAVVEAEAVLLITTNAYPRFKQSEGFDHWITHRDALTQAGQIKVEEEGASLLVQLKKMAAGPQEIKRPSTPSPSPSAPPSTAARSSLPELPVPRNASPLLAPSPIVGYVDMTFDLVEGVSDAPGPPSRARSIVTPGGASPVVSASVSASIATYASSSPPSPSASSLSSFSSFVASPLTPDATLESSHVSYSGDLQAATPSPSSSASDLSSPLPRATTSAVANLSVELITDVQPTKLAVPSSPVAVVDVSDTAPKVRSTSFVAPPSSDEDSAKTDSVSEDIWFKKKSPSKGVPYYINVATKQTTWDMPQEGAIYSCMLDEEGRMYYANIREKTSCWDVPDCLKDFVEIYKLI